MGKQIQLCYLGKGRNRCVVLEMLFDYLEAASYVRIPSCGVKHLRGDLGWEFCPP